MKLSSFELMDNYIDKPQRVSDTAALLREKCNRQSKHNRAIAGLHRNIISSIRGELATKLLYSKSNGVDSWSCNM